MKRTSKFPVFYGPYAIRTHYLPLRRRPLYPGELKDQYNSYLLLTARKACFELFRESAARFSPTILAAFTVKPNIAVSNCFENRLRDSLLRF